MQRILLTYVMDFQELRFDNNREIEEIPRRTVALHGE
jgi:hypothetical protein